MIKTFPLFLSLLAIVMNIKAQTPHDQAIALLDSALRTTDDRKSFEYLNLCLQQEPLTYAAVLLADYLALGKGTTANIERASEIYKYIADSMRITEQTNNETRIMVAYACRRYAMLLDEKDISQKKEYFNKAHIISGDALSEYCLSLLYLDDKMEYIDCDKFYYFLNLAADKDCIMALGSLAEFSEKDGDSDKAYNCWKKAADISPVDPVSLFKIDMYSAFTNPNITTFLGVIESWNTSLFNLGVTLLNQGLGELALTYLKKLTIEKPDYLIARAMCYAYTGEKEFSDKDFKRAIELAPNDGKTYNAMGVIYSQVWGETGIASEYFKKAIELGYENATQNYKEFISGK